MKESVVVLFGIVVGSLCLLNFFLLSNSDLAGVTGESIYEASASGDEFYVSQSGAGTKDGSSASNAWDGWSSIDWDLIGPGDTLYVMGIIQGGYGFSVSDSVNGAAGNPIMIKGYPENSGVLYEGYVYEASGWTGGDFGTYHRTVTNCNYVELREWTDTPLDYVSLARKDSAPDSGWGAGSFYCEGGSGGTLHYKPSDGVLDGKKTTPKWSTSPSLYVSGDYITFEDLTFDHGIRIGSGNPAHYVVFDNCTIQGAPYMDNVLTVNPGGTSLGSSHGTIKNCDIYGAANGIYLINQGYDESHDNHNWTIANNKIHDIAGSADSHAIGIQGGDNHLIEHNEMWNCGSGVTFWVQGSKMFFREGSVEPVQGDVITSSSGGQFTAAYRPTGGVSGSWDTGNATGYIRINDLSGTWDDGDIIYCNGAPCAVATGEYTRQTQKNCIVRYNYIHDMNTESGGNGRGIEYSGDHSENELISGGLVYGNIIEDVDDVALRIKATGDSGWKFYNNLVLDSKYGLYALRSNYVLDMNPSFSFINNVVSSLKSGGYDVYMLGNLDLSDKSEVILENNFYWTGDSANLWRWSSDTTDYSSWASASGDSGASFENPLLSGFRPAWDSPLIDAGLEMEEYPTDYFGNPIYGTPDVGAVEYQPPYNISLDEIEDNGKIRIYSNGKFRYLNKNAGENRTFIVEPSFGYATYSDSEKRDASYDLELLEWNSSHIRFDIENLSYSENVDFTICSLTANSDFNLSIDGNSDFVVISDSLGCVYFEYSGKWSRHQFELSYFSVSSGGGDSGSDDDGNFTDSGNSTDTSGSDDGSSDIDNSGGGGGGSKIKYSKNVISQKELESSGGYFGKFRKNFNYPFNVGGDSHEIVFVEFSKNKAKFIVHSDPVSFELGVGETKKLDLNSDGSEDLVVLMRDIDNNYVDLNIWVVDGDWHSDDGIEAIEGVVGIEGTIDGNDFAEAEEKSFFSKYWIYGLIVILLIGIGIVVWLIWERKKKIAKYYVDD